MSKQPWNSKGSGYQGIAISHTGHVLVSGERRRAILCGASKKRVSGRQSAQEYVNAAGNKGYEWQVEWSKHMSIRTSADTLLVPTNGVTCPDCRASLEKIRG